MSINKKLDKLILDPNFDCNNTNSVNKRIDTSENDLYILARDDSKCYEIIRLSKHKISVMQKYLYVNGIISELQNNYLNTISFEDKVDFLIKRIREYELWLLGQGKTDDKNYKLLGSIRLLLTCEKVKINKYSDRLDSNKKIRKKEQKVYSLLGKQKRKLERRSK